MSPYKYYDIMRNSKDNRVLRHQVVTYASQNGIKPAMRHFIRPAETLCASGLDDGRNTDTRDWKKSQDDLTILLMQF